MVHIRGFEPSVTVLATKTRPKRLVIVSATGQRHAFLLKGREDLVRACPQIAAFLCVLFPPPLSSSHPELPACLAYSIWMNE